MVFLVGELCDFQVDFILLDSADMSSGVVGQLYSCLSVGLDDVALDVWRSAVSLYLYTVVG